MTTHEYRQPTHREDLERTIVGGIACFIGGDPAKAKAIADGIKTLLDGLAPAMPQPASIAAPPVIDPGHDSLEQEIQAKGLTAPRVTPADIEANIASEHYFTARDGRRGALADGTYVGREKPQMDDADLATLDLLTFCVLVLRNGFTVTGESACASPENFDAEIGRKIARQNAVQKIWPLMGYELRSKLDAT